MEFPCREDMLNRQTFYFLLSFSAVTAVIKDVRVGRYGLKGERRPSLTHIPVD